MFLIDCIIDITGNGKMNENLEVRSEIYSFLAMVFSKPPNAQIVPIICEKTFKNVILQYFEKSALHDEFKEIYAKMTEKMETNEFLDSISLLSNEFNQLFMVPGSKYLIPYESHYHLKRSEIPGTILSKEISSFYTKAGFILNQENVELPDFIGNELAFAGIVLKKISFNGKNGQKSAFFYQLYSQFLKDHLSMWIPLFCEQLKKRSKSYYFKTWAIFLNRFIEGEQNIIFNNQSEV